MKIRQAGFRRKPVFYFGLLAVLLGAAVLGGCGGSDTTDPGPVASASSSSISSAASSASSVASSAASSSAASSASSASSSSSVVAVPSPDLAYGFDNVNTTSDRKTMTPYAGTQNMVASNAANAGTVFNFAANKAGTAGAAIQMTSTGGSSGTSDFYTIANGSVPAAIVTPAAITVEAMIQFAPVTSTANMIVAKHIDAGNTHGFSLYVKPDGATVGFRVNNSTAYEQAATIATNSSGWTHIVATYDGTTIHLYVNGAEVGTGSAQAVGALVDSATALQVGGNSSTNATAAVNGVYDDLRFYSTALTSAQVAARYATY